MSDKEKMLEILKAHTKKHNIMASVVILEEYIDELIKNGCVITCINDEKMHVTVEELKSASEWFTEHGRNTNTAIIGICERAADLITRQNAEIERLNAVSEAELDTIHRLGEDYEKALEEINRKNAEIEKLTVQKNAFAAGMKVEAEKAKEAQTEIERLEKARQKQAQFLEEERGQKYELINKITKTKTEAIKEFADEFKKMIKNALYGLDIKGKTISKEEVRKRFELLLQKDIPAVIEYVKYKMVGDE